MRLHFLTGLIASCVICPSIIAAEIAFTGDWEELPANQWVLLNREDNSGGKRFAKAVIADNRVYLWGTGGAKPARNVYQRYELESFSLQDHFWESAFPDSRANDWKADSYPPFRIYGQSGPDGLGYDEGPRLKTVGGYNATNQIQWWDFDGLMRPSPVLTFNMACFDSRRNRIVYFSDSETFALDPSTNSWIDLKAGNHPTACGKTAWAHMAYDAGRDRIMLQGGGLATNASGGAPTWFYDCQKNRWTKPDLRAEPPLRCNGAMVADRTSDSIILFGGFDQSAARNDTWVYNCKTDKWKKRTPNPSPPPMFAPASAALPDGRMLVCGSDARNYDRKHSAKSSAKKETWLYDSKANQWSFLSDELSLPGYSWLTADYSEEAKAVLLVAFGKDRLTYAVRVDAENQTKPEQPRGAKPDIVAWKYSEQKQSLEQASPADRSAHGKLLRELPTNTFVNAEPPGLLVSKTWSTATIDTDRSEVVYTGGGHSGYSGNDIARYDIASNRWSQDAAPRFPPFLEGTNAGIYGWSYGMIPFSQHTYLWYDYDPQSKSILYLARPSINAGDELQLTEGRQKTLTYDPQKQGYASWVYDSAGKQMHPPSFGRPFKNEWHTAVKGTPDGLFVMSRFKLYRVDINAKTGATNWKLIDDSFPKPKQEIRYHYEFQPLVHDSKRHRLVQLKGDASRVDVFARSTKDDGVWKQLKTKGDAAIGREAVYLPKHDTILWLGNRLYAFDCRSNQMRELAVDLPAGLYGHECSLVYDEKHDVCVALIPKSFSGPLQTFLFRYKPK